VSPGVPSLLTMVSDDGVWADVTFQPASKNPFQSVVMGLLVGGEQYFATVSTSDFIVVGDDARTETYVLVGSIGELRDTSGAGYLKTRLDGASVRISLTVNVVTGGVTSTSLALQERS